MHTHLITLTTRDAQQLQFDCREDEDIISAAERNDIILLQQCRSGACSACTATTVSGEFILTDYNKAALSDTQRAQNNTLLCRTYPRSALQIKTDYRYAAIQFGKIPEAQFTITDKQLLTAQVMRLVLQQTTGLENLLSANLFGGQFMYLMPLDKSFKRAYSLANAANWEGQLEFLIQLHPEGTFARFIQSVSPNDKLIASGPQGNFSLHENGLKPRWFIAGNTGLSPILAMLRQMAVFGEMHPARLFFGLRHEEDIFFTEVLDELQHTLPDFQYQICLSRAQPNWTGGFNGSVLMAVEVALKTMTQSPDIYLCGSDRLVDGLLTLFNAHSLQTLYYERFTG